MEMNFTLDDHRMDIECPRCKFPMRAFLRQVRLCDVIVCGGCKANIQPVDHMGTFRRATRNIDTALGELLEPLVTSFRKRLKRINTADYRIYHSIVGQTVRFLTEIKAVQGILADLERRVPLADADSEGITTVIPAPDPARRQLLGARRTPEEVLGRETDQR